MLIQFNKSSCVSNLGLWVLLFDICLVRSPLVSVVAPVKGNFCVWIFSFEWKPFGVEKRFFC